MASSETSALPRQRSSIRSPISNIISDLQSDPSSAFGSMSMDDILQSIYSDNNPAPNEILDRNPNPNLQHTPINPDSNRTVDEVWKEIEVSGSCYPLQGGAQEAGGDRTGRMTLEDYLTKAGAVTEEDVRGVLVAAAPGGYAVDPSIAVVMNEQFPVLGQGGMGKRRLMEEQEVDKATQQKQRRMIKNRESAARSRERKQAYTVELESLVTQLEEENVRLLREEAEHNKERLKQLKESLMPVVEKQGQGHVLRRVLSLKW